MCFTQFINGQVPSQDTIIQKSDSTELKINFKDPLSVVKSLIWAVEKKNLDVFRYIVDPIDNKAAIAGANNENQKFLEQILFQLTEIEIAGQPIYNSNKCKVPIIFTKDGRKIKEKFDLINRFDNWYIYKL